MKQLTNITVQDERRMYKWKCIQRLIENTQRNVSDLGLLELTLLTLFKA